MGGGVGGEESENAAGMGGEMQSDQPIGGGNKGGSNLRT